MIVYLDLVIISTVIVNYAILKTIALVFKESINVYRFIFSLIYGIIIIFLFIFPFKSLFLLRYLSGILVVIIAFPFHNIKSMIIKVIIFYTLNITFIGTIVIFKIHNIFMLAIALIYVLINWLIENYKFTIIKEKEFTYDVKIAKINIKGYYDSGNVSYYNGLPIIYIKKIYYNETMFQKIEQTIIKGLNSDSIVNIYKGPPLIINQNYNIVSYVFLEKIDYDLIIHRDCHL